jgi:hypothetical protein
MLGASFYLSRDLIQSINIFSWSAVFSNVFILGSCTYLLFTQKIATHWLVLSVGAIGWISYLF